MPWMQVVFVGRDGACWSLVISSWKATGDRLGMLMGTVLARERIVRSRSIFARKLLTGSFLSC